MLIRIHKLVSKLYLFISCIRFAFFLVASSVRYHDNDEERKVRGLSMMAINHGHSLARREYIKQHDSFTRALSRREI